MKPRSTYRIFTKLLCAVFVCTLSACGRTSQPLRVTKVTSVPENFVSLSEIQAEYENIFQYSIYADAVIYFTDLDDRTIDTQQLNDASVLVSYQDEWYIEDYFNNEVVNYQNKFNYSINDLLDPNNELKSIHEIYEKWYGKLIK